MRFLSVASVGLALLAGCGPTDVRQGSTSSGSSSGSAGSSTTTGTNSGMGASTVATSTGTSSTSSASTSSTTRTSTSSGTGSTSTCSCAGCTNLGLACDVASGCMCVANSTSTSTSTSSSGSTGVAGICSSQRCVVYAQTDHELYQVDPTDAGNLQDLCAFGGALGSTSADAVNDIAVRADGQLYAITKTDLYTVDPSTCAATHVQSVAPPGGNSFNCLGFLSDGTLLGATSQGDVTKIDPTTGAPTQVGSFGGGLKCSGDIVAVSNGVADLIFASAKPISGSSSSDKLVSLDPNNGYQATVIGDIGSPSVFGLGFWGGKLYGFTSSGDTLEIDPGTGHGNVLHQTSPTLKFYGAGTTPRAPIISH